MAFEIKQGDRAPSLLATCTDDEGDAVDLSGSTVLFRFKLESLPGATVIEGAAVLVGGGTTGLVRYDWADGDTDVPGNYIGEFIVTDNQGIEKSFPSVAFMRFSINRRLS